MRAANQTMRRTGGFMLLELLIAVTLLGIVTMIAVPAFNGFIANQQVKTSAQGLFTNLNYARSEAIRRNENVFVRMFEDGGSWIWVVTPHAPGSEPTGWVLADCLEADASADDCLRVFQTRGVQLSSAVSAVAFRPNGRASSAEEFRLCDAEESGMVTERIIRIGLSGSPSISLADSCEAAI